MRGVRAPGCTRQGRSKGSVWCAGSVWATDQGRSRMWGQKAGGYSKVGAQGPGDCAVEIRARDGPPTAPQGPSRTLRYPPLLPAPYPPQPRILHRDFSEEEVDVVAMLEGVDEVRL